MANGRITNYTFGEARTDDGQLVRFTCSPEELETVREYIAIHIRSVDIPTTNHSQTSHGAYGRLSRYSIRQHRYAGGSGGFIEVLEITAPPDDRCGIVIHDHWGGQSNFSEWLSLEQATNNFETVVGNSELDRLKKLPGFIRHVNCSYLTPWFYAVGTQVLFGDFVLPENMQDDPVYRCGQKFVVYDTYATPTIKTCVGCRFITRVESQYVHKTYHYRLVYWDDGTVWDDHNYHGRQPRPLLENEIWITEALEQFRKMLTGLSRQFTINFTDGTRFIGRISIPRSSSVNVQGDYFVRVWVRGKKSPIEGWVRNFEPTPEAPTLLQYISHKLATQGNVVTRIEVIDQDNLVRGKKWAGVFWNPKS